MADFLREYNIFIVLMSCLLNSIMVIQSYINHRRDKIHKNNEQFFGIKMSGCDKTSKVCSIRCKYRRQFMLTAV